MAIKIIRLDLVLWKHGEIVTEEDSVKFLQIEIQEPVIRFSANEPNGASATVTFIELTSENFADEIDPQLFIENHLKLRCNMVADWLRDRSPDAFGALRQKGIKSWLHLDAWIDQNQIDLNFPAKLLAVCGERNLDISIVSND